MKKRMRYICCLMLAASLTAGLLAGCGNDTAGTKIKAQQRIKRRQKKRNRTARRKPEKGSKRMQ